jgi:rfaE bifunctional protein nucleotidyltransferase chain/domain
VEEFLPIRVKIAKTHKKLVFTNGCFDIIHRGHVEYLQKAREKGDFLLVGLNTDDSIRRIKGDKRPIVDQESRAIVLAELESVDFIIYFDEDTPLELIRQVKPDVLIKGADYAIDEIVGAKEVLEWGGEVETVELTPGFSTSGLIEKIKRLYCH